MIHDESQSQRPVAHRWRPWWILAVVIFGLQFVDRSFGPILPLFIGEIGVAAGRIPLISGLLLSIAAGAGRTGAASGQGAPIFTQAVNAAIAASGSLPLGGIWYAPS